MIVNFRREIACGLFFQWWSYKHILQPRTPAARGEAFCKLFILSNFKNQVQWAQPRSEPLPSQKTHWAVLARLPPRSVCTDSYGQGWAHLATRVVHILYWTPDFPIFADSQYRCLGWQLNPDRKQGTSGDASPIPRLLSTQKAVWEQHKGSDPTTLLLPLRFRAAGLSPFPLLPCPAYFTGWKCARLYSANSSLPEAIKAFLCLFRVLHSYHMPVQSLKNPTREICPCISAPSLQLLPLKVQPNTWLCKTPVNLGDLEIWENYLMAKASDKNHASSLELQKVWELWVLPSTETKREILALSSARKAIPPPSAQSVWDFYLALQGRWAAPPVTALPEGLPVQEQHSAGWSQPDPDVMKFLQPASVSSQNWMSDEKDKRFPGYWVCSPSLKQNPTKGTSEELVKPYFPSLLIRDLCPPVPPVPSLLTDCQSLCFRRTIHLVYKGSILHLQLHWRSSLWLWSAANRQKYKTQEDWVSFHLRRVCLTCSIVLLGSWSFPLSHK